MLSSTALVYNFKGLKEKIENEYCLFRFRGSISS